MSEATRILNAMEQGDPKAAEALLPPVYDELRRLAAHQLANEAPGHTLQATALVHEAWLRLQEGGNSRWNSRNHFFQAAAEAMRRILVEHARHKRALKCAGSHQRVPLEQVDVATNADSETVLLVEEALERLAATDPVKAEVVKLRFFVGLSAEETGQVLGLSEPTVKRHWAYARAWLYQEIERLRHA
ncbi:MAG: sigma-70 family RNA polymerase sigma factor [Verrucomicrobia bacterium]|nr:sigma-70 family RNA polymerase sigma factor [Verrucomicrobiota bacterium]